MTATEPRLQIRDLRTTFGNRDNRIEAVRGVDLDLDAGATYTILGESGSGKSVTARSIMRLYGRNAEITGSITLDGDDLTGLRESQMQTIRGRKIAMVPQDPTGALDPLRSIGSQVTEVLRAHKLVKGRAGARTRAVELLSQVGIADPRRVMSSRPHQLSGGMRQRAVIALAIACEPDVLIADEPTTALDVTVQAAVIELILDLQRTLGMALLMVTHDVGVAEELGGDVGVMYAGRLAETGPVHEVLSQPRHPYTQGLLASLPTPDTPRGELPVITGRPPLTGEATTGCAFAARCPLAEDSCGEAQPVLVEVAAGRHAACPVINDSAHTDVKELTA